MIPEVLAQSQAAAVFTLDRLTGFQYGLCTQTVFPCRSDCPKQCTRCPECRGLRVDLYPLAGRIDSIESVTVGAVEVDPADYQLTSHRYLVPFNPGALYPIPRQLVNRVPGSVDTWSVDVVRGTPVPDNVLIAASDLMCQFVKMCTPGSVCDIEDGAVSVTREGVTVRLDTGLDVIPSVKFIRQTYGSRPRKKVGIFDPARFPRGSVPSW